MRFAGIPFLLLILAGAVTACAPRPTATPGLVELVATIAPASPTRTEPPTIPRESPTIPSASTAVAASPTPSALPTARARLYDEVDEQQILAAVFPDTKLTQDGPGYQLEGSKDWVAWINDREEGFITQAQHPELVAIVANQVGPNAPKAEAPYGPSSDFVAILEKRDGNLVLTHRENILPPASPLVNDVRIERAPDVFGRGQDELLITTNTVQNLITRTEAHLYRWQLTGFLQLWNGLEQDDNTAAINQDQYYTYQATIDFADVGSSGTKELIVDGKRTLFSKDSDGRADLSAATGVSNERQAFKWDGHAFVIDQSSSTPGSPGGSPTP